MTSRSSEKVEGSSFLRRCLLCDGYFRSLDTLRELLGDRDRKYFDDLRPVAYGFVTSPARLPVVPLSEEMEYAMLISNPCSCVPDVPSADHVGDRDV